MKIRGLRVLTIAATAAAIACAGGVAYGASNSTSVIVKGPDHERLTFTLAPGHSEVFKLPATNDPIQIDLDKVSTNGGVQTPSEVFSALVNADRNKAGISWIGTNSDGSQHADSTIDSNNISNLVCGVNCTISSLDVESAGKGTLVLRTNAATSIIKETYVVNIWY
jgi:hypothetical protein